VVVEGEEGEGRMWKVGVGMVGEEEEEEEEVRRWRRLGVGGEGGVDKCARDSKSTIQNLVPGT